MNNKALSLLGLCKKAGKLSMGHDASIASIVTNKAKLCMLCEDISERQKDEMTHAAGYEGRNLPLLHLTFTMDDIQAATGWRAGILTINDEGFAHSFIKMLDNTTGRNAIYDQ